jgi:hypothetical protein
MKLDKTGTWLSALVPERTIVLACLNGLNILPSYTEYFNLNAATTGRR